MTIEQTRQLGIEFERRLQTMFPAAKTVAKIDTEDIYSFLNLYQLLYIQQLYLSEDLTASLTRPSILVQDILRTLIKHQRLTYGKLDWSADTDNHTFELPSDYYQYIRSTSIVRGTYKGYTTNKTVPNVLAKQSEVSSAIESYYNDGRILRNPIVVLEGDRIKVVHDQYTTVGAVDLTYLRLPSQFDVLTSTACELPYECFDALVTGALDLYIRHILLPSLKQQLNEDKQLKERRNDQ